MREKVRVVEGNTSCAGKKVEISFPEFDLIGKIPKSFVFRSFRIRIGKCTTCKGKEGNGAPLVTKQTMKQ